MSTNRKRAISLIFILSLGSCGIGWFWGVQTVRKHLFPYGLADNMRALFSLSEKRNGNLNVLKFSPDEKRKLSNHAEAIYENILANGLSVREDIINRTILPPAQITVTAQPPNSIEEKIVASFYGIKITGILKKTTLKSSECLIVYTQGHGGNPFDLYYHNELRKRLTNSGCDFLSLSMLGLGLNRGQISFPVDLSAPGIPVHLDEKQATMHNLTSFFHDQKFSNLGPLALFLSGHYKIIHSLRDNYSKIAAIGISGGGWYTTILSALIPDIELSISVAGSLPLAFRLTALTLEIMSNLMRLYGKIMITGTCIFSDL